MSSILFYILFPLQFAAIPIALKAAVI